MKPHDGSRVRALLRDRAVDVLPEFLLRRLARLHTRGSALSVVVLVTDHNAPFLEECVRSVTPQLRRADELLVMVIGTAKDTLVEVGRQRGSASRVVELPGSSVAAGMDQGARSARGSRLLFVDAGERIAPGALAAMAGVMEATGAELVGATPRDLGRAEVGDLMLRRELWNRARITVSAGPHTEWVTAARLLLAARTTSEVGHPVRQGARRGTGEAFGAMPLLAPWIPQWASAVDETLNRTEDGHGREELFGWLLGEEVPRYLEDAERCTPEQWGRLVDAVRALLDAAPAHVVECAPVEARVRLWLAANAHRPELEQFNVRRWLEEGEFPTRVEGGELYAVLPLDQLRPPATVLALGPGERPFVSLLRGWHWGDDGHLKLEVLAYIRRLPSDAGGCSFAAALVDQSGTRTELLVQQRRDPEANVVAGDRFADHSTGAFGVEVDVDRLLRRASAGDRWHVQVDLTVAGVVGAGPLTDPDGRGASGVLAHRRCGDLVLRSSVDASNGLVLVAERADDHDNVGDAPWCISEVLLDGGDLVLRGAGPVAPAGEPPPRLRLRGAHASAPVDLVRDGSDFEARLRLVHNPWALGERSLPPGSYRVHAQTPGQPPLKLGLAPELTTHLPLWQRSDTYRMRVLSGPGGGAQIRLAAPLAPDEAGAHAQQQLQQWYASADGRIDPDAVYLQSYTGQSATDSPLAIHHALRSMRPDLRLYWAVADRSTSVPEGAQPVLLRSREWYAALATAGSIVTNIDMDRWFRKRPGQRLLQSFHGYPSKTMGIAAWVGKNFTPLRIEAQLRRTSGTWDLLLTPTPDMDAHYRREYRYDGAILAGGYPRDDVLVGPRVDTIRASTRSRLGLAPGQRAVLYAPTWRDDLATNFRSAMMATTFDVERAAAELGDEYVFLVRGHRFHRRRRDLAGARILDVTDYPEINDLVLAADVAVLDYSSLRFDFALTGRPMVFLVPDLDRYTRGMRGFLFDFAASAPGPLVSDTSQVVARLADLTQLALDYHDDLERFNAEFNRLQDGRAAERAVQAFFGHGAAPAT